MMRHLNSTLVVQDWASTGDMTGVFASRTPLKAGASKGPNSGGVVPSKKWLK